MTGMNFELSPEGQGILRMFQQLQKEKVAPRALRAVCIRMGPGSRSE